MQVYKISLLVVALNMLVGCFGGGYTLPQVNKPVDRAPTTTHRDIDRLASLPDPKVEKVSRSRGGNAPTYTVLGKSYRVMDSAQGFRQQGTASWYGTKFHGRPTSNGEKFDIYKLTAAHKHLPLPTYVRVSNLSNGKKTIVRVNDRGPFHDDRVIDLSYAAAVKLGFHDKGTAQVLIEVVKPEPAQRQFYMLQAGAYRELQSADSAHDQLRNLTGMSGVVVKTSGDGLYRVHLGPVQSGDMLDRVVKVLETSDYGKPRLIPAACHQPAVRC